MIRVRAFSTVATVVSLEVFAAVAFAGTKPLFRQQFVATGPTPNAIASGDIDHDGRTDFVVADDTDWLARSYRSLGDARFEEAGVTSFSARPRAAALANLAGDSNLDLAFIGTNFATTIPTFGVIAGNGAFQFLSGSYYGLTFEPVSFILRDLDLDGDLDVVISGATTQGQGRLVVRKNNAGSFGPEVLVANLNSRDLDCGDIESDGFPEIVAIDGQRVRSFKNQMGSSFAPMGSILETFIPASVALADFTGDGKLDLATVAESFGAFVFSNPIVVRVGRGDGGFDESSRVNVAYLEAQDLIAADIDHDGDLDLDLTFVSSGLVLEMKNDGIGHFRVEGGSMPTAPVKAIFDADGDLDLDLFGVDPVRGGVGILLRDSLDGFRHSSQFASPGGWKSATFGDTDHDGRRDAIAIVDGPIVHRGLPNGGLTEVSGIGSLASGGVFTENPFDSILLDVNQDGDLDLLWADQDLRIAPGQAGASLAPFGSAIAVGAGQSPALVAADFDHDGDSDIVVVKTLGAGGVLYPVRNQNGAFVAQPGIATPKPARHVAVADFDTDGNLDVAIACDDGVAGEIVVRFGDGNLGFPTSLSLATPRVSFVAALDWTGDGKADVITGGKAQVFVSNGAGGFALGAPLTPPSDATAELRGVRDVDGDGRLDLVYRGKRDAAFGYFQSFVMQRNLPSGWVEESIATAFGQAVYFDDLDADGSIELLTSAPSVLGQAPGSITVEHPALSHDPCGGSFEEYGYACAAKPGDYLPYLTPIGCPGVGGTLGLALDYAAQYVTAFTFLGTGKASAPVGHGCTLAISGIFPVMWTISLSGTIPNASASAPIAPSLAGTIFTAQTFVVPASGIGFAASNGVKISVL